MPTHAESQAFRQAGRQAENQAGRQAEIQAGRQAGRQRVRQAGRWTNRQAGGQTGRGTMAADRSEKVAMNSLTSVTASSRLAMRVGLAARLVLARTSPCSSAAQLTKASQLLAL